MLSSTFQNFIAYKFVPGKKTVSKRTLQVDAIAITHNKFIPEQSPGPVVQKLDGAIHRIIHYPLDKC